MGVKTPEDTLSHGPSLRWKVTSKEALAQISEYSEAGITVRGTYYAPGKQGLC